MGSRGMGSRYQRPVRMNQIPKKRRMYRGSTSETSATARMSGMIVPKSPSDPANSERENESGRGGSDDMVPSWGLSEPEDTGLPVLHMIRYQAEELTFSDGRVGSPR
jgi:hypothetical protein